MKFRCLSLIAVLFAAVPALAAGPRCTLPTGLCLTGLTPAADPGCPDDPGPFPPTEDANELYEYPDPCEAPYVALPSCWLAAIGTYNVELAAAWAALRADICACDASYPDDAQETERLICIWAACEKYVTAQMAAAAKGKKAIDECPCVLQ